MLEDFANQSKLLVVVTSQTKWNEVPRMRHNITTQLSRFYNVIYVELDSFGQTKLEKISNSLLLLKVGCFIRGLNRINAAKNLFNLYQSKIIDQYIRKFKAEKKIIINFKFDFYQAYALKIWTLKYYFMNDDFVNMPPHSSQSEKEGRRKQQNKTISNVSRVFVSSDPLGDDIKDQIKNISIIYSGHDFTPTSEWKASENLRPVLCFMGTIHDELEAEWIDCAASTGKYEVRLIGPVESTRIRKMLDKNCNIRFYEPLIGDKLQVFLHAADAFLMPYKLVEINTKASVPAKLFQYLACGKPIISSKLPHLIKLPKGFIYESCDPSEFINNIELALNEDEKLLMDARFELSLKNTWNYRGEKIFSIIEFDLN